MARLDQSDNNIITDLLEDKNEIFRTHGLNLGIGFIDMDNKYYIMVVNDGHIQQSRRRLTSILVGPAAGGRLMNDDTFCPDPREIYPNAPKQTSYCSDSRQRTYSVFFARNLSPDVFEVDDIFSGLNIGGGYDSDGQDDMEIPGAATPNRVNRNLFG